MKDTPSIRVGCSGWAYKHWRGLFYPEGLPQSRWFERYAEEFDTVELNNSFYRLPKPETFAKWRDQAPPGFRYAVKANRFITQGKKLHDCAEPIARMMHAMESLGNCTGPLLFQLPPTLKFDPERLDSFLNIIPTGIDNVFEFRDSSWYRQETFDLLDRHGASLCAHDMQGSTSPRVAVGPVVYVRFHGTGGKYVGRYSADDLKYWAGWAAEQLGYARTVWCYFNNDIHGHAIDDARALKSIVSNVAR